MRVDAGRYTRGRRVAIHNVDAPNGHSSRPPRLFKKTGSLWSHDYRWMRARAQLRPSPLSQVALSALAAATEPKGTMRSLPPLPKTRNTLSVEVYIVAV